MTFSSSQIYFFICAALLIGLLLVCLWVGMKGLFQGRKEFETQELNSYVYSDELAELEDSVLLLSVLVEELDA